MAPALNFKVLGSALKFYRAEPSTGVTSASALLEEIIQASNNKSMISFIIKWKDLDIPLTQKQNNSWVFGDSYVEIFNHSIIESFLIKGIDKYLLVIRERLDNFSLPSTEFQEKYPKFEVDNSEYELITNNLRKWPLEFLILEIVKPETSPSNYVINLEAGVWGTAPVYLISTEGIIAGSWDITKLYPFIDVNCVDIAEVIYFLSGIQGYTSRTIFKNIKLLTERAKAFFEPGSWHIEYPEPAPQISPHFLTEKALVTDTYREILSSSLQRWSCHRNVGGLGCELSGGLDSANVTAIAPSVCDFQVATYGTILLGEMGRQQERRRKELIEKFHTLDYTVDASHVSYHPLSPNGSRLRRKLMNPYEELYSELFEAMLAIANKNGHKVILTGIGGDELVLPDSFEIGRCKEDKRRETQKRKESLFSGCFFPTTHFMHPLARIICEEKVSAQTKFPKTKIPESALNAARFRAPMFLRNGIWPLNPLCTPELVEFCHKLPLRWRAKKYLQRQLLKELNISKNTIYPKIKESFSGLMNTSISNTSKSHVKRLFEESYLSEINFIDQNKISKEYESFIDGKSSYDSGIFFMFSTLEMTLRSITGR